MQIISLIQDIWVALILFMAFARLRIGICLYVAYIILVPYLNIHLGISLQWNLVNTIMLIAFLVSANSYKNVRVSFKPYAPFVFLMVAQLLEMPFQGDVPIGTSFSSFRLDFMSYLILPFVIWNQSLVDPKLHVQLRRTVILCICLAFGYGLFLTTTDGNNPYQMLITAANGMEWNEYYAEVGGGRMFGRISSVFSHPMTYGLFLGMALIYIYSIRAKLNKFFLIIMLLGIIAAIFLCGIRSPIGAFFVTILIFLLLNHKVKLMIEVGIVGCLIYAIILKIPDLYSYVGSIFSDDSSEVAGSSKDMRLDQLMGCFHEIRNNLFFGKGYNWTGYYHETYGDHPVMLAFESLIYVVLCNSGIVGVFIWLIFIIKLFINTSSLVHHNRDVIISEMTLLTYYIAYAIITGDYGYMKFFILFYTLILLEDKYTWKINPRN